MPAARIRVDRPGGGCECLHLGAPRHIAPECLGLAARLAQLLNQRLRRALIDQQQIRAKRGAHPRRSLADAARRYGLAPGDGSIVEVAP